MFVVVVAPENAAGGESYRESRPTAVSPFRPSYDRGALPISLSDEPLRSQCRGALPRR